MTVADDFNAKLDEIQGKVNKIGSDLAAEVALLQQSGQGGLSAADATALMGRLSTISDNLTTLDITAPPSALSSQKA